MPSAEIPGLSASERATILSALKNVKPPQIESMARWAEAVAPIAAQLEQLNEGAIKQLVARAARTVDWDALAHGFRRVTIFYPENLWGRWTDLEEYAELALEDGIAIAWVVPMATLTELIAVPSGEERLGLLLDRRDHLLGGCTEVLGRRPGRWTAPALEAVAAASEGYCAAAQSLAANVVDSVVLAEYADEGQPRNNSEARRRAKEMSEADLGDREKVLLDLARELTSLPLKSALAQWYPGDDPPRTFNRHATAHCAGEGGVYTDASCLTSVMLAASLACQYPIDPARQLQDAASRQD